MLNPIPDVKTGILCRPSILLTKPLWLLQLAIIITFSNLLKLNNRSFTVALFAHDRSCFYDCSTPAL